MVAMRCYGGSCEDQMTPKDATVPKLAEYCLNWQYIIRKIFSIRIMYYFFTSISNLSLQNPLFTKFKSSMLVFVKFGIFVGFDVTGSKLGIFVGIEVTGKKLGICVNLHKR